MILLASIAVRSGTSGWACRRLEGFFIAALGRGRLNLKGQLQ
jgi:hypothetical protein